MSRIPVYLMPGLAASSRIFERISLDESLFEVVLLDWIAPLKNENIQSYCKRLIDQKIKHENPVLLGVSLGGILVQEIAEQILVRKIIIVSSIKTNKEMPLRMRWAKKTKLYKLLPTRIVRYFGLLSKLPLPSKIINRIKLYIKYLSVNDVVYLNWAIKQVINWNRLQSNPNVIHIHGTEDGVFPAQNISNFIPIKGGTHTMILSRYNWFNQNLPVIIQNQ